MHKNNYLVFKKTKIWCWDTRTSKWTLDVETWCTVLGIFFISTISRLWEKYHKQCKMMNVHLIHLRHYLN